MQVLNCDPLRHITGVTEVMHTTVVAIDQAGIGFPAAGGYKQTITDHKFSLPGAAIVAAKVDQAPSTDGRVLQCEGTGTNGIDTHVPQG